MNAKQQTKGFLLKKKLFGKRFFTYRHAFTGYAMIAPAFLLLTVFVVVPLVMAIYRSFFDYRAYADEQILSDFKIILPYFERRRFSILSRMRCYSQ